MRLSKKVLFLSASPILALGVAGAVFALQPEVTKPSKVKAIETTKPEAKTEATAPVGQSEAPEISPLPPPAPTPAPDLCPSEYGVDIGGGICQVPENLRTQVIAMATANGDTLTSNAIQSLSKWIYKYPGSNPNDAELCNMSHLYPMPNANAIDDPVKQLANCHSVVHSNDYAWRNYNRWTQRVINTKTPTTEGLEPVHIVR